MPASIRSRFSSRKKGLFLLKAAALKQRNTDRVTRGDIPRESGVKQCPGCMTIQPAGGFDESGYCEDCE